MRLLRRNIPTPPSIPTPPRELRALVGRPDLDSFTGTEDDEETLGLVPPAAFENVLDFGCGCGRVTRTLLERRLIRRYVGIDCNLPMVAWCQSNLATMHDGVRFEHHDVYNPGLNAASTNPMLPLPGEGYSLILASSVFTHLPQREAEHYLSEAARVLAPDGCLLATFFFFDKRPFPMMQPFQHALYINQDDITNAVLFTRQWLDGELAANGLVVERELEPPFPGHQWRLLIRRAESAGKS